MEGGVQDDYLFLSKRKKRGEGLEPGNMTEGHFWLLIEVSSIHSEKVIQALQDFLVLGYFRREACERNKVSAGYFSTALGRLQRVSDIVSQLAPYYIHPGVSVSNSD
ncbi:transcriptional regulator [Salmonella enterica]|nr:transcriptional regulator [Salmonella enterica]EBL7773639.1 transcriptional regulator [Salmonella enterica]EHB8454728.1 transcriptional regulator [Salmonella enterica]HBM0065092.1 adhesin biosynthesis transcription regulatory family protein [Salmonella enterica subsp. enterica serovar Enteritidis]